MHEPRFPIAVTADDETAPVLDKVKRRLAGVKKAGEAGGKGLSQLATPSHLNRLGIMARTLGRVERATSSVTGYRAPIGELTSRWRGVRDSLAEVSGNLGIIRSAYASAGGGAADMAKAAREAAGGLAASGEGAVEAAAGMSRFGIVASAAAGILTAGAYAAYKWADAWSKGALALGNFSNLTGIAANRIEALRSAGEANGKIPKAAVDNAVMQLTSGVYDAQYGRNPIVQQTLAKLKVKVRKDPNGEVDAIGMLPDIADAIARQPNAGARRTVAGNLGITDLLPLLRLGGNGVRSELARGAKEGPQTSAEEIEKARKLQYDTARRDQMAERTNAQGGSASAGAVQPFMERVTGVVRSALDAIGITGGANGGGSGGGFVAKFESGAGRIYQGGESILKAAMLLSGGATGGSGSGSGKGQRMTGLQQGLVDAFKAAGAKYGVPPSVLAAQYQLESGGGRHMPAGSNNPFGIKAKPGQPGVDVMTTEYINGQYRRVKQRFAKFDTISDAIDAVAKLLGTSPRYARARAAPDDDAFADALTGVYATDRHYGRKLKGIMHQQTGELKLLHHHTFSGLPSGARVRTDTGDNVAVSHAMAGKGL